MKKLTTLAAALLIALSASAVPAKPVKKTVTLTDGTTVTAILRGDEHHHSLVTADGRALKEVSEGIYDYSDTQTENETWSALRNAKANLRHQTSQKRRQAGKPRREFGVPGKVVGEKRGLVILVEFSGASMKHTQQEFDQQFNQVGYSKNRHIGSVRDYFKKQSYDQLTIDFDVVGPYPLAHPMSYYGKNASFTYNENTGIITFKGWSESGEDVNAFEMIYEACQSADKDVNFADYDWDGDGYVDQVYVIYNGYGEASGAASTTIWPHEYELSMSAYYRNMPSGYPDMTKFANLTLDGVHIDTYACSNELSGTAGTMMDGIGTACHEFTHCLGIPDFYDTSYSGNFGMGNWDLMDQGSYNGPSGYEGCVPAAYTAYERWFSGWLEPVELDEGANVADMAAITDKPVSYVVYNQGNRNEFYLLQNIQKTSWNQYAGGHGMLVQHIFYDKDIWQANEPNTTGNNSTSGNQYQRCTIIPADNTRSEYNLAGDPFPGTSKKTALTNTSMPSASLYVSNSNGSSLMNRPIEDIKEQNGLISFTFNGGAKIDAPVANEVKADDLTADSFRATWSEVSEAAYYNVELTEYVEEEETTPAPDDPQTVTLLLDEDFAGVSAQTNSNVDISADLDRYLHTTGWTGSKVYSGTNNPGGVKIGASKTGGRLQTPLLQAPQSNAVTLYLRFQAYGTDAVDFTVSFLSQAGNVITTKNYTANTDDVFTVSIDQPFSVKFETVAKKRVYLLDVKVADGTYDRNALQDGEGTTDDDDTPKTVVTTIRVEDATEHLFSDLTASQYSYRVQAVDASGNTSAWSNVVSVTLPEPPTHIAAPTATDTFEVYTLSGLRVKSAANAATWRNGLPRGTYILRSQQTTKKAVK